MTDIRMPERYFHVQVQRPSKHTAMYVQLISTLLLVAYKVGNVRSLMFGRNAVLRFLSCFLPLCLSRLPINPFDTLAHHTNIGDENVEIRIQVINDVADVALHAFDS